MNHELLMILSKSMPMKAITVNGMPYLRRYFISIDADGTQHWLHHFLRSDSERHLHSHPWFAYSTILCGWYREQYPDMEVLRKAGEVNQLSPDTLHRIVDVKPDTWTYMTVYPTREPTWYFINDAGEKTIEKSSPTDWYLHCKPRDY